MQLEAEAVGHGEQVVRAGILLQGNQVGRHGKHLRDIEGRGTCDQGGRPGELRAHGEGNKQKTEKRWVRGAKKERGREKRLSPRL